MPLHSDSIYLRTRQYQDSANLRARASLHERFSTNPQGWLAFVLDQLDLRPGLRVLEIGGGPGWLWWQHPERVPGGLSVVASDLSLGMVREARHHLAGRSADCRFASLDAQAAPFTAGAFDLVTANHMLYHVPDLPRAVGELARVLAAGGRLCATTNGHAHLRELHALLHAFEPSYTGRASEIHAAYALENAAERLRPAFDRVEIRRYPDSFWVTAAAPLAAYALSLWDLDRKIGAERAADLEAFFESRIHADGGIHITKDAGVVLAYPA